MQFRVLGPLEVADDSGPLPLGRRRTRALLAYLLLHANEPVSADRLIDELWPPEPPKTVGASLQNYVSRLRKVLGPDVLLSREGGYELRVDPEQLDLARFERLVAAARDAEPEERAATLRAALSLWRGPALEDLAYEPWAQDEVRRLEELRLSALESRLETELGLGRDAELVPELEALVTAQPLRERPRAMLMLALYRVGRQADALDVYRDGRRVLRDELGLEPSPALRRLERAILEQDPALRRRAPAAEERAESRRTVTVLFCDVVDSTRLARELDPEAYRRLMTRYFAVVRGAVERHGGTVEKFIGDAVMALFGVPELHEDDALRALRAAVEARAAVDELDEDVAVRIALESGEVHAGSVPGGDLFVSGAAIGEAAHLQEGGEAGEILLGGETWRLVRGAARAEPVERAGLEAWRLEELRPDAAPFSRRLDAPLVGRVNEVAALRVAYDQARDERRCRAVAVVGDAGIGKSRVLIELCNLVAEEARVLVGRCAPYGEGATYLPLREALLQAAAEPTAAGVAALADDERAGQRVAELLGLAEGPPAPAEAFWAVRRLLEAVAREHPLVLVLEDVHWAEPTLLDLVDYLAQWSTGAPLLVLCAARPELLERRQAWDETVTVVRLDPLEAEEVGELVGGLAKAAPEETRARVVELAGGNPLYAEQLVAAAEEAPDEPLERAPGSLEALIASRVDRLRAPEQSLLRRAAVIGRRFPVRALAHLLEPPEAETLPRRLAALERKGFVHAGPDDLYRFHHALVRDAAYRSLPKSERGPLHERVAAWLDLREDEPDELVGYHLEQAYRCGVDVGDGVERVGAEAAERLGRAGVRAWRRGDTGAATNLLGRATALPGADEQRRELQCELGVAFRMRGEPERAENVLRDAAGATDRRVKLRAELELATLRMAHDPASTSREEVLEAARDAIRVFEQRGDVRGLGRAWLAVATVRGDYDSQSVDGADAAARAAEYYRQAGWSLSTSLSVLAAALFYGPFAVEEAIATATRLVDENATDRLSQANVLVWRGALESMRGDFEEARHDVEVARRAYEEFGQTVAAEDTCGLVTGVIEMLAGRYAAAEEALRRSCEACLRLHESALLASRAAELARALYAQERFDEAETWVDVAETNAAPIDVPAQFAWRSVRAKLRAQQGEFDDAERLIGDALEIVERTDSLNEHANVLLDFAEVLRLAGRGRESHARVERAVQVYEQKGNVVAANRARDLLRNKLPA